MAGPQPRELLRPSLLDRLAVGGGGRAADLRIGVAELRQAVRRDIEWLLNTRRSLLPGLDELPEASSSHLAYGIPDLTQFATRSAADRQRLCGIIAEALRRFEPRLVAERLTVEPSSLDEPGGMRLRFVIRGVLHIEPILEPITFDTSIEMASGAIEVTAAD
jgi:type VI secretion system protein ImpF